MQLPHLLLSLGFISILSTPAGESASRATTVQDQQGIHADGACSPWDSSINAGLTLTRGTVDSILFNIGFETIGTFKQSEVLLSANYLYGETNSTISNDVLRLAAQYNYLITDQFYAGIAANFLTDNVAAVDYRINAHPTLGYYLIKNEQTKLAIEAGVGYTWEKQNGLKDDRASLRFAERFSHTFLNGAAIFQNFEIFPALEDLGNYIMMFEAGFTVPLTEKIAFKSSVRNITDSQPAPGLEKNDLTVLAGITYGIGASPTKIKCKHKRWAAANTPAAAPALNTWSSTASLGYAYTSGNSDSMLLTTDVNTSYLTSQSEFRAMAAANYGELSNTTSIQTIRFGIQYNRYLSNPFYVGARLDFLYDELADLSYRLSPALVAGLYLIKTDNTRLSFEMGPAITLQKQGGISDTFLSAVATERFEHSFSDRTKIWQSCGLLLNLDDTKDYIVNNEIGLSVKLSGRFSFRLVAQDIYDAQPAINAEKNEIRLTSGIGFEF
jgi:putative salt-induced outer membrane protein YdiY